MFSLHADVSDPCDRNALVRPKILKGRWTCLDGPPTEFKQFKCFYSRYRGGFERKLMEEGEYFIVCICWVETIFPGRPGRPESLVSRKHTHPSMFCRRRSTREGLKCNSFRHRKDELTRRGFSQSLRDQRDQSLEVCTQGYKTYKRDLWPGWNSWSLCEFNLCPTSGREQAKYPVSRNSF